MLSERLANVRRIRWKTRRMFRDCLASIRLAYTFLMQMSFRRMCLANVWRMFSEHFPMPHLGLLDCHAPLKTKTVSQKPQTPWRTQTKLMLRNASAVNLNESGGEPVFRLTGRNILNNYICVTE